MPQILPLPTLALVCMWYGKSTHKTKTLQELDGHNTMKDVDTKKGFHNLSKQLRLWPFCYRQ